MRCEGLIAINISRFKEGARVLEDIARFVLKDLTLFDEIKRLKHSLNPWIPEPQEPQKDIGGPDYQEHHHRQCWHELVHANARRMQESARVLEELLGSDAFKKIRYQSYEIHQKMQGKLNLRLKKDKLKNIYPLCDPSTHPADKMIQVLNDSEISLCQLRMKHADKKTLYAVAQQFKQGLRDDIALIINDHVDIALMLADGVHVGQDDLPVSAIKKVGRNDFIVGVSTHSVAEATQAEQAGADYISVGCLFPTKTKQDLIKTSLETLEAIKGSVKVPVCAIGGITQANITLLKGLKVDMFGMQAGFWG